jgi:hypothetical protein
MFDYMQILMAMFLINVNLPPTAMYTLATFKLALFSFLPNFFTSVMPIPFYDENVMNNSAYSIMKSFSFLFNMGQIYFILIVTLALLLLTFGFSKKFFNKKVKAWCKQFIK